MFQRKEESILAFGVLFILFLVFYLFNEPSITGAAVIEPPIITNTLLAAGTTLDDLATQLEQQTYTLTFVNGDTIACLGRISTNANVTISFYRPGDPLSTPYRSFSTNTANGESTQCFPHNTTHNDCIAFFMPAQTTLGAWGCLVTATNTAGESTSQVTQTPLRMLNTPPALVQELASITLDTNGTYEPININEYFNDPDNQTMQFKVNGHRALAITIASTGNLIIENPSHFTGQEHIQIAAYDGYNTTFSSTIPVYVGTLPDAANTSTDACTPFWDCGEWDTCTDGLQTRTCTDTNACGTDEEKPEEEQSCSAETIQLSNDGGRDVQLSNVDLGALEETRTISPFQIGALSAGVLFVLIGLGLMLWQKNKEKTLAQPSQQPGTSPQPALPSQPLPQLASVLPQTVTPVQPQPAQPQNPTQSPHDLQRYTDTAIIVQKKSVEELRAALTHAGWPTTTIDQTIRISQTKAFIAEKLTQGFAKETLKQTLLAKGWTDTQFETLYNDALTLAQTPPS